MPASRTKIEPATQMNGETRARGASAPGGRVARSTGGLRSDLKRFTRERILNAALSSFQEVGFKETTVERIVELAGTTAPTFYRHFNGKDELLPALQDHLGAAVQACLERLTPQDIRSPETLTRWIGDYMDMWSRVHRLCKAFWDAASLGDEMDPATFAAMFNTGDTIMRLFPDADPNEIATRKLRLGLLMLLLDRLAYIVSVAPDQSTRDDLSSSFAAMMWNAAFQQ